MTRRDEAIFQANVVRVLRSSGVFCHSVPNEGAGDSPIRMGQLIRMGLTKGVPDLVAWWPKTDGSGQVTLGYLELKTPRGKLSEAQETMKRKCQECGVIHDVIRSMDDLYSVMADKGVAVKEELTCTKL